MNSSSIRRLAADHAALHRAELPPYYLFPDSARSGMADDLTQLNILLVGPQGTPYSEGIWKLQLRIPQDYPASPPKAFFRTKIWHPNVEDSNGSVCLDTLKRDWQPKLTLRDILITISCLLINPNPDSALNSSAGKLLQEDWDAFSRYAKMMASVHAKIPLSLRDAAHVARRRGEEAAVEDDESTESEEEEENCKENDPALSPSPLDPSPPGAIRRPTVLGKRPLGDLPTPPEPPSDDECEDFFMNHSSERNIAANTPNLSSNLACMGLAPMTEALRRSPKLMERNAGVNFTNQRSNSVVQRVGNSTNQSDAPADYRDSTTPQQSTLMPSAKRIRSGDGKENQDKATAHSAAHGLLSAQAKSTLPPSSLVGLGVKAHGGAHPPHAAAAAVAAARKGSSGSGGSIGGGSQRAKPRVGLRRL